LPVLGIQGFVVKVPSANLIPVEIQSLFGVDGRE